MSASGRASGWAPGSWQRHLETHQAGVSLGLIAQGVTATQQALNRRFIFPRANPSGRLIVRIVPVVVLSGMWFPYLGTHPKNVGRLGPQEALLHTHLSPLSLTLSVDWFRRCGMVCAERELDLGENKRSRRNQASGV